MAQETELVSSNETSKFDKFKKRYEQRGGNFRQIQINSSVNLLSHKFKNDPSYHSVTINDVEGIDCRIYENNSYSKKYGSAYIQTMLDYELHVGDLITFNDKVWLCTYAKLENEIYYQGTIIECNYELHWIDDEGNIKSSYCFVDDGTSNVDDNALINHQTGKITVQLPITQDTIKISENKRFLIDIQRNNPNTYKVTSCNYATKGCGYIYMERDIFSPSTDNIDLMIADYYGKQINEETNEPSDGEDIIQLVPKVKLITDNQYAKIGTVKTVTYEFIDAEDTLPVWNIETLVDIPHEEIDNGIQFKIPYDLSLIGQTIGITITNSSSQCEDSIILKVRGVV